MLKELSDFQAHFLEHQGFVIVSTLDFKGMIHCSAKGIVGIEKSGKLYLIDLYKARTYNNLKKNPLISVTAVDEHQFVGYTLQGTAKLVERDKIKDHIIEKWEEKVLNRISERMLRNLKAEKQGLHHPEALFGHPEYLIEVDVENIIDLTPAQLKKQGK